MGMRFADCELAVDRWEMRCRGELVSLEPRAMSILVHLVEHRDRVVSKAELLDQVWGDQFVSESALTTQIKSIRCAVGDTGPEQRVIRTVHGQGYRFIADVESTGSPRPPAASSDSGGTANPVVAVLPFSNQSEDRSRRHVADGLTAEVIAGLSKHRWLRVLTGAMASGYGRHPDAITRLRDRAPPSDPHLVPKTRPTNVGRLDT